MGLYGSGPMTVELGDDICCDTPELDMFGSDWFGLV